MAPPDGSARPIGRIHVSRTGEISFDGARTTLEALRTSLADLRARHGVVWYHRETAGAPGDAPPEAMAVIQLVIAHRLPISMSTTPDFSDVVRPDGQVVPRADPPTLS
jgi:hypothetical protein